MVRHGPEGTERFLTLVGFEKGELDRLERKLGVSFDRLSVGPYETIPVGLDAGLKPGKMPEGFVDEDGRWTVTVSMKRYPVPPDGARGEAGTLSGWVVEADNTAGRNVVVKMAHHKNRKKAVPGPDGRFEITGPKEGIHGLKFIDARTGRELTVLGNLKDGCSDIFVILAPEKQVSFLVTGEEGQPLLGAEIATFSHHYLWTRNSNGQRAITDENGEATLGLRAGNVYCFRAKAEGHALTFARFPYGGGEKLQVKVKRGGALTGKVLLDKPELAKGLRLELTYKLPMANGVREERFVDVGEDMTYRVGNVVPDGNTTIKLYCGRHPKTCLLRHVLEEKEGDREVDLDIRDITTVSGKVTGRDGKPLAEGKVWLWVSGTYQERTVEVEPDGGYRFENVRAGTGKIEARVEGRCMVRHDITITRGPLRVDFPEARPVRFHGVATVNGEKVQTGTLQIIRDGRGANGFRKKFNFEDGSFSADGVPEGSCKVNLRNYTLAGSEVRKRLAIGRCTVTGDEMQLRFNHVKD